MNKKTKKFFLISLILIMGSIVIELPAILRCANPNFIDREQVRIDVWGRSSCNNTERMVRSLRSENLKYMYHNVDYLSNDEAQSMRSAVQKVGVTDYTLPVVQVGNQSMVSTGNISDIFQAMVKQDRLPVDYMMAVARGKILLRIFWSLLGFISISFFFRGCQLDRIRIF